jgi:hypothetical protein
MHLEILTASPIRGDSAAELIQVSNSPHKEQTQVAKQGRRGHDDPPGNDHNGYVVIG